MGREKSGGIVLILSVALAMILANSNIAESYFHFFEQEVGFIVNGEPYLNYSLHHWINDGLMAMFFFVVGLELKENSSEANWLTSETPFYLLVQQ